MEPGIVFTRRYWHAPTRPASSIGPSRWTPRSLAPISTRRTSPGSRGASSNCNNPLIEPPDHGFGRSRGGISTKLHHLVDGHGLPLVITVTPGQFGDSPMLIPLLAHLRVIRPTGRPRTRPNRLRGDKAYSSRAIRQHLRDRGHPAAIRPDRSPRPTRLTRQTPHHLRPRRLPTPQRHRTPLRRPQAMARPRYPLRQTRHRLPLTSRPQRRHRLDATFRRHALAHALTALPRVAASVRLHQSNKI